MNEFYTMKCYTCKGLFDVNAMADTCPECGSLRHQIFYYNITGEKITVVDVKDIPRHEVECENPEQFDAIYRATEATLGKRLLAGHMDGDLICTYHGEVVMRWYIDRGIITFNLDGGK